MKVFQPFRIDVRNQCLWRNGDRIKLTPKTFSLLAYLVDNAGSLLSQTDIIDKLWPDTFIQPEVLRPMCGICDQLLMTTQKIRGLLRRIIAGDTDLLPPSLKMRTSNIELSLLPWQRRLGRRATWRHCANLPKGLLW